MQLYKFYIAVEENRQSIMNAKTYLNTKLIEMRHRINDEKLTLVPIIMIEKKVAHEFSAKSI